jgi:hypothetical protein
MTAMPLPVPDPSLVARLERLARTELSTRARLAHVLLVLVASTMTIAIVSLWLTEPVLPARTHAAFGMLTMIGVAWVAYGAWVLRARRVMLARQRVVAGRLAVTFTGAFTIACVLLAATTSVAAGWPAAAMGLVLLAAAVTLWRRAEAHYAALVVRRDTLERELQRSAR